MLYLPGVEYVVSVSVESYVDLCPSVSAIHADWFRCSINKTRESIRSIRTRSSRITLRPRRPLLTLYTLNSLRSLRSLQSSFSLNTLNPLYALLALRANLTLNPLLSITCVERVLNFSGVEHAIAVGVQPRLYLRPADYAIGSRNFSGCFYKARNSVSPVNPRGPLFSLQALRTSWACFSLNTLQPLFALRPLLTLYTLNSLRPFRSLQSSFSLNTLNPLYALLALRAFRSLWAGRSLLALKAGLSIADVERVLDLASFEHTIPVRIRSRIYPLAAVITVGPFRFGNRKNKRCFAR